MGEECPRAQTEGCDVAERSDREQSSAAQSIDQPQSDESENEIGDADSDRLQQCCLGAESGHLEYARREIEDRVDSGELIEERDQEREHDRHTQDRKSTRLNSSH